MRGPSRGPREWLGRGALAAGLAAAGFAGVTASAANVLVRGDPARAHALAHRNGTITARLAQQRFTLAPDADARSATADLARLALRQDPTAVDAVTVLAFQAQFRRDRAEADRLFAAAALLSRRELRPQIWAIEDAAQRGDIAAALRHYDIALRTSRTAQDLLFPTLAAALAEPQVRTGVLTRMRAQPVWGPAFVSYAALSGVDPQAAIRFIQEGRASGLTVGDDLRAVLVDNLFGRGLYADAWAYYAANRAGAARQRSRNPDFTATPDAPTTFDWTPDPQLAPYVTIGAGAIDFSVPPSNGGLLVRQSQMLAPGRYRIEGRSSGIAQPARTRPYWVLACITGAELGRVEIPSGTGGAGAFSGTVTVPQGCAVQTLALIVRSSDDIAGVSGRIGRAALVPSSGR